MTTRWNWLAVAVLAASSLQAQAQDTLWSQTRARLGQLSFTIYDATPDDGAAPSFRFLDAANAWRTYTYIDVWAPSDDSVSLAAQQNTTFAAHQSPLLPGVQSVGIFPAEGFGGAGGAFGTASGYVVAQGQAWSLDRAFTAHAALSSTATGGDSPTFRNLVLGPGTGVLVKGYGITEAWLGLQGEYAWAQVQLLAEFSAPDGNGVYQPALAQRRSDTLVSYLDQFSWQMATPYVGLVKVTDQRQLSLSFENLTAADMVGRVRFAANGDGASAIPVPELGAAWLLLAGLPFLGSVALYLRQGDMRLASSGAKGTST